MDAPRPKKIKECLPPLHEIDQLRVRQRLFLAGDDAAYLIGCHRRRVLLVLGARHAKLESAVAREWMRYSHSVTFSDGEAACFARICLAWVRRNDFLLFRGRSTRRARDRETLTLRIHRNVQTRA